MIILACETSTLLGSVAVLENNKVLSCEESMRQNSHSEVLNLFIEKALEKSGKKLSDVDLFVTGIGPGSFTGIRICLNTIKTLAYCFNKPVIGINSLQSLAAQAFNAEAFTTETLENSNEFKNYPVISMINAYKNMVYVATHRFENKTLIEVKKPEVVRVQNLAEYISEKSIICGDGYPTYEKYIPESAVQNILRFASVSDEPHAKTLAALAFQFNHLEQSWNNLIPLYLRASEAEENLKGIKYQPLF